MVAITTVIPVFLEQQGASRFVIALLPALTHLCAGLTQPFAGYLSRRSRHIWGWVFWMHLLSPIPIGLIALGLYYRIGSPTVVVLAGWSAFFGLIGILFPMWLDYMARVLIPSRRGRAFGAIFFTQTALGVLGISLAAWVLERGTTVVHYSLLFGIAWATFTGGSLFFIGARGENVPDKIGGPVSLLTHLKELRRLAMGTRWFRVYLPARLLVRSTFYLILSFYAVHAVAVRGVTPAMAALFGTAALGVQAFSGIFLGMLGDRYGHKVPVMVGQGFMVLGIVLLFVPAPPWIFFFVAGATGVFMSTEIGSQNNWLIDLGGPEHRQAFISLTMFLITPTAALATLGGGALMDRFGFPPVAAGVGVAFLLALILEAMAVPSGSAKGEGPP